ncbi:NYN domain-containing protein, partial [Aurantimonas sp. C2-6-R+9]|nr:NYN domain-containing protein [Aurantimonas sp. C2-6-R+9]
VPVLAIYYKDMRDEAERDRQSGLLRRLSAGGFEVRGAAPEDFGSGPWERYGTNLVEMAVDVMTIAPGIDRVILVAGDRKLIPLVHALQAGGIQVTVATALNIPEAIRASEKLIEAASAHVDLTQHFESEPPQQQRG